MGSKILMSLYEFQIEHSGIICPVHKLTNLQIAAAGKHIQDAQDIYAALRESAIIGGNFTETLQQASDQFLDLPDVDKMIAEMIFAGQSVLPENGFQYDREKATLLGGLPMFVNQLLTEFGGEVPFIVYTEPNQDPRHWQRTSIVCPEKTLQLDIAREEFNPMQNNYTKGLPAHTIIRESMQGSLREDPTSTYGIRKQSVGVTLSKIGQPWMNISFYNEPYLRGDGIKIQTITVNGNDGKQNGTNLLYTQLRSRWDDEQHS